MPKEFFLYWLSFSAVLFQRRSTSLVKLAFPPEKNGIYIDLIFDFLNFSPMNKQRQTSTSDFNTEVKLKGFKAYEIDSNTGKGHSYSRKDFYKISLNIALPPVSSSERPFQTRDGCRYWG